MIQTAFGRVKIGKKCYVYLVKVDGKERVYKRVGSSPCKTIVNYDSKLMTLLEDPVIAQGFINGIEIVIKKN